MKLYDGNIEVAADTTVVAGIATSSHKILFVFVVFTDPLFSHNLTTVAVEVPEVAAFVVAWVNRIWLLSTRLPFAPAV